MLADSWVLDTWTGPSTLDQIGDCLDGLWADHPHVPKSVRMQVGIAVGEIAANIIEHAAGDRPVRMRMKVRVRSDQVQVCFSDDGGPAHLDLRAVYKPDVMAERGRGLAMAHEVLERLRYRRFTFNHWTLHSKRFSPGPVSHTGWRGTP